MPAASLRAETINRASVVMKALGHPVRLRIVEALENNERTVKELQAMLNLPQAVISQQLAFLRRKSIVGFRRRGTYVYYSLTGDFPLMVLNCMRNCNWKDL